MGPTAAFFGPTGATGPTGPSGYGPQRDEEYLLNRARMELIGASDNMLRSKFYEVFTEFFSDSSSWQELLFGQLFPGVRFYWLEPQEKPGGKIIKLDGVYDPNGFPISAAMPKPQSMELVYLPNVEHSVAVRVIKTVSIPHDNAMPHVPYWVISTYEPYILAGVFYHMQIQKDRAYSDPVGARLNYYRFREGVVNARADALRKNTFGKNSWIYPQQFRTTSQQGGVSVGNNFSEF